MLLQTNNHVDNAQSDKLRLLYHQSFPSVFFNLAATLIYTVIFWQLPDHTTLLIWLSAVAASTLMRLTLFISYKYNQPDNSEIFKWELPYFITLTIASLIWGIGTVIICYNQPVEYQFLTSYFLIGLAGSALSVYSSIRFFAISTILIILLPITVWFLLQDSVTHLLMASANILFLLSALRATSILSKTLHKVFLLTHELTEAKNTAEHLAKTDVLTGLNNRRAFTDLAKQQLQFCQRERQPVSLLMIDLDLFKDVNDTYGHAAGDIALQQMATLMLETVRSSDICGRTGGEEFAILLPNTNLDGAADIAEKLRLLVTNNLVHTPERTFRISISTGVASGHYGLETLLHMADKAMYHAKQSGRNQIKCYDNNQLNLDFV